MSCSLGEGLHLTAEAVADLLDQRRRGDRVARGARSRSVDDLTTHLQVRDVGVQIQPVDAGEVEADMTVEHVVDVRHAGHARQRCAPEGRLCRPDNLNSHDGRAGRRPGGGPAPLPLNYFDLKNRFKRRCRFGIKAVQGLCRASARPSR